MGIQGGSKGKKQATEMVKDLGKFIKFEEVIFEVAIDRKAVIEYVENYVGFKLDPVARSTNCK